MFRTLLARTLVALARRSTAFASSKGQHSIEPSVVPTTTKNRVEHVDVAKGISIFLVVLFHSEINALAIQFAKALSLIRMPLFFFLSGVFFNYFDSVKNFLAKKGDALLKPYFVTLLGVLLIGTIEGEAGFIFHIKGILYGNGETIDWVPLWFLPHLFALYCFGYLFLRVTDFQRLSLPAKSSVLVGMILLAGPVMQAFWHLQISVLGKDIVIPGLPYSMDLIPLTGAFFLLGRTIRDQVVSFRPSIALTTLSFTGLSWVSVFTDARLDLNRRMFVSPFSAVIGALCGIYLVLTLSWFISRTRWLKPVFLAVGGASLFILIFHYVITRTTHQLLDARLAAHHWFFVASALSLAAGVFVPLGIKWIAKRNHLIGLLYLPIRSNRKLDRV